MENIKKSLLRSSMIFLINTAFFTVFSICFIFTLLNGLEMYTILTNSADGFKDYPFGTELGYMYRSKEVYCATSLTWFFIYFQSLVTSILFYRNKQALIGLLFLLTPHIIGSLIFFLYGNFS